MILREIAGENILVPVGQTALRVHGIISLSESGLLLWKKLQQECTEAELIESILKEYDIDKDTASKDVSAFLDKLDKLDILIKE